MQASTLAIYSPPLVPIPPVLQSILHRTSQKQAQYPGWHICEHCTQLSEVKEDNLFIAGDFDVHGPLPVKVVVVEGTLNLWADPGKTTAFQAPRIKVHCRFEVPPVIHAGTIVWFEPPTPIHLEGNGVQQIRFTSDFCYPFTEFPKIRTCIPEGSAGTRQSDGFNPMHLAAMGVLSQDELKVSVSLMGQEGITHALTEHMEQIPKEFMNHAMQFAPLVLDQQEYELLLLYRNPLEQSAIRGTPFLFDYRNMFDPPEALRAYFDLLFPKW